MKAPELSVVIPCFNEEAVLLQLRGRLVAVLEALSPSWEVVLVDDGSSDATLATMRQIHREDPRFVGVALSRNFGHQAALVAGLAYARGDAVAVMDADLQDPPEVLARCMDQWRQGAEVVYAIRETRQEGLILRAAYKTFYRLLSALADVDIPLDSGDFCLMDRKVADVVRVMPERNMFVRGMRAWAGFRQVGLPYERAGRAAGSTKYPFRRLLRLALDGIFSFSTFPLRLATWVGLAIVVTSLLGIAIVFVWRFTGVELMGHTAHDIPGWAGALVVALFFGAVQLLFLGVLGEYLARIYDEVKRRPRWVVRETLGLARDPGQAE